MTCGAYALPQLDTIDPTTGGIDKDSVLNLVVFGVNLRNNRVLRFTSHKNELFMINQGFGTSFGIDGRRSHRFTERQVEHVHQISV